jgi:hypothetical protein
VQSWEALKEELLSPAEDGENLPQIKLISKDSPPIEVSDIIALASYSRAGNSMLRGYLEKIMGLATGSDGNLNNKMVMDLYKDGFVGEGLTNSQIKVVKTHYPEKRGTAHLPVDRAILLARNPLDTITSLFNLVCTGSHSHSIKDDDYINLENLWNEFVLIES